MSDGQCRRLWYTAKSNSSSVDLTSGPLCSKQLMYGLRQIIVQQIMIPVRDFPMPQSDSSLPYSLVYADKPQALDHLEDNIRRVIADIRPQMLEKVIENWTSRLDYIRASCGSHMP
ncbi:hypothetical protein TNCV_693851 [Trichonephila clavipes]|nr:hypothetical protein TNCV_693851 [Trichonephila clavipes]